MESIRSVFIGNFAKADGELYSLKSYAQFYNDLALRAGQVKVFAGYFLPSDPGFEFSYEQKLNDKIEFTLTRGNSSTTKLLPFLWNNIVLFLKLTSFCFKKGDYFVFLPSPIGVWSVLILTLFRRTNSLGIYIGGHYGREQAFEDRKGKIKKSIKRLSASLVDRLVIYAIRKSDYVITSSYEYHSLYSEVANVILTPPMINVDESDLYSTDRQLEHKCITYCGELRHAKGVVDLLKAFALLVNERQIVDYKLKIIGTGQAYKELTDLAETNGIMNMVVFCGQIKQRDKLKVEMRNSAIFVLPSYSEGFPRVAYEAFALGVPTILTPVGGIPYLVKDGVHCLLASPGNINELAENIERLLQDDNLRRQLVQNSKQLMADCIFPRIKKYHSLATLVSENIGSNPA